MGMCWSQKISFTRKFFDNLMQGYVFDPTRKHNVVFLLKHVENRARSLFEQHTAFATISNTYRKTCSNTRASRKSRYKKQILILEDERWDMTLAFYTLHRHLHWRSEHVAKVCRQLATRIHCAQSEIKKLAFAFTDACLKSTPAFRRC